MRSRGRGLDIDIERCPNCGGALKIIAAIEDPPVIVKILSHLGLSTRARPVRRRVESIYSRQSEQPKTACQRKPTELLALSSSEQLDKGGFARLPTALCPSRPVFHQAQTGIDNSPDPGL